MPEECRVSDKSSKSKRITPRRPIGIRTEPPDFIALMIHEHIKLILSISSVMSSLLHRNRIFSSASAPSSLEDFKVDISTKERIEGYSAHVFQAKQKCKN